MFNKAHLRRSTLGCLSPGGGSSLCGSHCSRRNWPVTEHLSPLPPSSGARMVANSVHGHAVQALEGQEMPVASAARSPRRLETSSVSAHLGRAAFSSSGGAAGPSGERETQPQSQSRERRRWPAAGSRTKSTATRGRSGSVRPCRGTPPPDSPVRRVRPGSPEPRERALSCHAETRGCGAAPGGAPRPERQPRVTVTGLG